MSKTLQHSFIVRQSTRLVSATVANSSPLVVKYTKIVLSFKQRVVWVKSLGLIGQREAGTAQDAVAVNAPTDAPEEPDPTPMPAAGEIKLTHTLRLPRNDPFSTRCWWNQSGYRLNRWPRLADTLCGVRFEGDRGERVERSDKNFDLSFEFKKPQNAKFYAVLEDNKDGNKSL